ncbi:ROK family protein [Desulfonatronovibrio hydrogenovorans]|uniref:ROK family protein n=1 Tax=Desulfonatronovibrio hydrogenovorans TaxID=53245 RepID=UPI000491CEA9|nr:ROK family protein [Desulfonatronovibrio hydrogenovorans]
MFICLDLGGSNIRGTWFSGSGQSGIIRKKVRPADLDGTKATLRELIREISSDCPAAPGKIGVASAGPMDIEKGTYLTPTNMPELKGFNLKRFVRECFGLESVLENDAQAAALGEAYKGCLAGADDAMVFTLGTGLGSGVIMDSKIWRGRHPAGPELGHLYLGPGRKIKCGCGQTGCAETWLNARALFDLAVNNCPGLVKLKDIDALLVDRDVLALQTMEKYGLRLGLYLSQVISVFGITRVGLSGGLSRLAPFYVKAVHKTLRHRLGKRKWLIPDKIGIAPDPEMSALWGMCFLLQNSSKQEPSGF